MAVDPKRVEAVFLAAIEQPDPAARRALLERECGPDQELRQRVEALLQAHDEPGTLLQHPPIDADPASEGPAPDQVGQRIGPYKLLQQIGEGGMGTVYMAEQSAPVHRMVALKIIKPGMDSRQIIARFEAERQALALMDHPNVARVLDGGTTSSGRPYFVMELVQGVPITEYCDDHRLAAQSRLRLFVDVCHAVQHAHQKGIIHRDLKPSNVLVAEYDGKPVPKVIDFGVAKAIGQQLTDATLFTAFGQVIGTVEYMSPEQAQFHPLDIDTRSDVYSLGVILYELLTGQTPFDRRRLGSAALDEVLRIIREEDPQRPSTRLSASQALPSIAANRQLEPRKLMTVVHGELDWIVMKAIEKDRGRRYETATSLAADVQRYLADEPVSAAAPSRAYRLRKFARRNRGPVIAAAVVFAALVIGIIGTTIGLISESRRRVNAERERLESELNIAGILHSQEDIPKAEALYRRVIAERSDSTDPTDRQRRARAMMRLAELVSWEGTRRDEAKTIAREAVAEHRLAYPSNDPNLARALRVYGMQFFPEELERTKGPLREAIEIRRKAVPMNYLLLGSDLRTLGQILRRQQRFAEAVPVYHEARDCYRAHFSEADPRLAQFQCEFACLLMELGRFGEAEAELIDAGRQPQSEWSQNYVNGSFHVLYTLWNDREPGKGYDRRAAEWRKKTLAQYVVEAQPATQP